MPEDSKVLLLQTGEKVYAEAYSCSRSLRPWSGVVGPVVQWVPSKRSFTVGLEQLLKFYKTRIKLQHKPV